MQKYSVDSNYDYALNEDDKEGYLVRVEDVEKALAKINRFARKGYEVNNEPHFMAIILETEELLEELKGERK